MEDPTTASTKLSIYKAARTIKRRENTLYNALRSIYDDSIFVGEISQLWPDLPLLANLRCGLWYSPNFHSTCYFKSTDGHANNWSFSTSRLNLHVAQLAGQKGGCIIVDSTRRGKRFPDSMSKTIPIWTCVLNRSIRNYLNKMLDSTAPADRKSTISDQDDDSKSLEWDSSLHLPLWVSETEKANIEGRLEEWTKQLDASGADIASLALCLKKPLRPLWISQKTVIWLNEVPDHDSWDFTPIILLSASSSNGIIQHRSISEFSWNYIAGAGDDEESWARGLSPNLFWGHAYDLISAGPDLCNQKVADMVEKDRVYRSQRGQNAPQVTVKASKSLVHLSQGEVPQSLDIPNIEIDKKSYDEDCGISWLGSANLAVGRSQLGVTLTASPISSYPLIFFLSYLSSASNIIQAVIHNLKCFTWLTCKFACFCAASNISNIDCILNCDQESLFLCLPDSEAHLHLPMVTSKLDRFSLLSNLPSAVNFAKLNLSKGKTLLVCCHNGEDISVCVCLAILTSLFNEEGTFDHGKSFNETRITKWDLRRRLVYLCKFVTNARPSRGNLKQVFGFLNGGSIGTSV